MGVPVVILPSPLLPATAYETLASALREAGADADVASPELADDETADDLVRRWVRQLGPESIMVPHSNAGYLAPTVRDRAGGTQPMVFMDAALPPATGATQLAPTQFRDFLADLAGTSRLLPPWTQWWPREQLEDVIPAGSFSELDRLCPRLPVGYFDSWLRAPSGWVSAANAYLAFGATYREELDFAVAQKWPHDRIHGGHLQFLHDPDAVAKRILDLAADLRTH